MWLCLQASIESLTVSSVGTTVSNGLWGLDRIDQQSRKRDYMYHYSSTGTGVHVYTVDTVSHQSTLSICNQFCCGTQQLMSHTCQSHRCRQPLCRQCSQSSVMHMYGHACLQPVSTLDTVSRETYVFELSPARNKALLLTYRHRLHLSCASMQAFPAVTAA